MASTDTTDRAALGADKTNSLLTIPLEMFEAIAASVEPDDLLNLRLVNLETEAKVHRTFVATHFTERMFLVSFEESLRTLLAIAKHEEFGRTMRTIILGTEELPNAAHPLVLDGVLLWRSREATGTSVSAKIRAEQEDREWRRLLTEKEEYLGRDGQVHLLAMIFSAFRQCNNAPVVKIMDQGEAGMAAHGVRTLRKLSARQPFWAWDCDRPINDVFSGLTLAETAITSLTINIDNSGWSFYGLVADATTTECAASVFSKLKNLHISSSSSDEYGELDAEKAATLFSVCHLLENLRFEMYTPAMYETPATAVNRHFILALLGRHLPVLKNITLQGFSVHFPDLIAFIARHESLTSAAFNHSCFCLLGEYDDGVNDKEGRHSECVQNILREVTGLSNISVSWGMVCQWRAREAPLQDSDDSDSEEGSDEDVEISDFSEGEDEEEDGEEDGSDLDLSSDDGD